MADDGRLAESARKIDEARAAAEEEKRSRPYGPDDEAPPPREPRQEANEEGFSPT
ncbi:hypothetical protein [Actinophytocola sp.]|uniref:hypothetical protein n=1 Tax=Actinophytocola sp. TaxID=1872138 RepID=UPI003899C9C5